MLEQARKAPSLKWKLVCIMLASWLLPVVMVLCVASYFFSSNVTKRVSDTMTASVENAARISEDRLEFIVAASRNASYNPAVWNAYRQYLTDHDHVSLYSSVRQFLENQYEYDEEFLSVNLYFCQDPNTVYFIYSDKQRYTDSGGHRYQQEAHRQVQVISDTLGSKIGFLEVDGSLYLVRNLLDLHFKPYGVIVHELNQDVMFGGFDTVLWSAQSTVWVNDVPLVRRGEMLPRPDYALFKDGADILHQERGVTAIYGLREDNDYRLTYAVQMDQVSLMAELTGYRGMIVGLSLLVVPLLLLAVRFFYVDIARPVGRLLEGTKHIECGEVGYQLKEACENREFTYLTESFNTMSTRLREQFERIYSEELALRDARIMALQSQINPHFLNNTLEIINWEARLTGAVKVSRMIEALSTMLDAAMDRHGKPTVRLAEEMMYVDAYLYITSERLGKRLTVEKEIQEEALECNVPRLVLQPIIENAVEHGIQARQKGVLRICAQVEEGVLTLQTVNDGDLSPEDAAHVERLLSSGYDASDERSGSLGIYNVNQRLKILFGEEAGLDVHADGKGHVVASIRIRVSQ